MLVVFVGVLLVVGSKFSWASDTKAAFRDEILYLETELDKLNHELNSKFSKMEPTYTGEVHCIDGDNGQDCGRKKWVCKEIQVTFPTPYKKIPKIDVSNSYVDFDADNQDHSVYTSILDVTTTGFKVRCTAWKAGYVHTMKVFWLSIPEMKD